MPMRDARASALQLRYLFVTDAEGLKALDVTRLDRPVPVAAAVVREPGTAMTGDAILDALEGRLARFKLPRRIVFVDTLPRNAMGKVPKTVLRANFETATNSR